MKTSRGTKRRTPPLPNWATEATTEAFDPPDSTAEAESHTGDTTPSGDPDPAAHGHEEPRTYTVLRSWLPTQNEERTRVSERLEELNNIESAYNHSYNNSELL